MKINIFCLESIDRGDLLVPLSVFIDARIEGERAPDDIVFVSLWRKYCIGQRGKWRIQKMENLFLGNEIAKQRAWIKRLSDTEKSKPSGELKLAWIRFESEEELNTYTLNKTWLNSLLNPAKLNITLMNVGRRRRAEWEKAII